MTQIYIASKTKHAPKWKALRDGGLNIISTWIDEAEPYATLNWPDLWDRCLNESANCDVLILYREPGEELKGAWVEVGAALSVGRRVIAVGIEEFTISRSGKLELANSLEDALARL